jgi:hypothetical protein
MSSRQKQTTRRVLFIGILRCWRTVPSTLHACTVDQTMQRVQESIQRIPVDALRTVPPHHEHGFTLIHAQKRNLKRKRMHEMVYATLIQHQTAMQWCIEASGDGLRSTSRDAQAPAAIKVERFDPHPERFRNALAPKGFGSSQLSRSWFRILSRHCVATRKTGDEKNTGARKQGIRRSPGSGYWCVVALSQRETPQRHTYIDTGNNFPGQSMNDHDVP